MIASEDIESEGKNMKQIFCTKKDIYGHRDYLAIDHEARQFTQRDGLYYIPECIVTTKRNIRQMIKALHDSGYSENENM